MSAALDARHSTIASEAVLPNGIAVIEGAKQIVAAGEQVLLSSSSQVAEMSVAGRSRDARRSRASARRGERPRSRDPARHTDPRGSHCSLRVERLRSPPGAS